MNYKQYENELDENKYKYNKMVAVNIIQLIVIVVLTGAILFFAMNQKTILKSPYPTNKDEIISDGFEDLEKLNHFAHYISNLTQNITYANANEQLLHLLPMVESSYFDEIKKDLKLEATYIIRNKITQIFYVSNIDVDQKLKIIKIKGVRERRVSGQTLKSGNNDGYETIMLTVNYMVKYGTYFRIKNLGVEKLK
ncbi:MAG: TraE/TraK family type IV conjugative transfer system protein [Arcobacteraceae bacterium]